MPEPLLRKIDCAMLKTHDLDEAVAFYGGRLGHTMLWRTSEAVAFRLPESGAELVVHLHIGPEVYFLVDDVEQAYRSLLQSGAASIKPPFDIQIGKCAIVRDPLGNSLAILDQSKGRLVTDSRGNVIGVG
jgi:predicted enzyme related to lactoylglutathione lyase